MIDSQLNERFEQALLSLSALERDVSEHVDDVYDAPTIALAYQLIDIVHTRLLGIAQRDKR